jgi:hypothetical protein
VALSDFHTAADDDDAPFDHLGAYERAKVTDLWHRRATALARANSAWQEHTMWSDQVKLIEAQIERLARGGKLQ